jgi:hypothetical protein
LLLCAILATAVDEMGHDSERAASIYQHQAQGADTVITQAIDAHAAAELRQDGTWPEPASPTGQWHVNGTPAWRVSPGDVRDPSQFAELRCCLERVTRIELALSAWEVSVTI